MEQSFPSNQEHLIFTYHVDWNYKLSPILSVYLNRYKSNKTDEFLKSPEINKRGKITTTDVLKHSKNEEGCQQMVTLWEREVYHSWQQHHHIVDNIAKEFINANKGRLLM